MNRSMQALLVMAIILSGWANCWSQSSSMYLNANAPPPAVRAEGNIADRLSPHIAKLSISAVRLPEPRQFALHDLVTIIVRESIENKSKADMETDKEVTLDGIISAFPNLQLRDLAELRLGPSAFDQGTPELGVSLSNEFEGEGSYKRTDEFTTRITARIADIRPNGTLILEARKMIQSDKESVNVVLTGTCRKEDVTIDNTVLSTQIYDMRLLKNHKGEIHNATKKGLITKFFEAIFNF